MLTGYNIGLTIIVFLLAARVFAEYPYQLTGHFSTRPFWRKYGELALAGIFFHAAFWVDKWIMWFAPEASTPASHMPVFAAYDAAMLIASLTMLPALALFVLSIESNFFSHYRRFYTQIMKHAPLRRIRRLHAAVANTIFESTRNLVILQGVVAFLVLMLAPQIVDTLNLTTLSISILRLGVLGCFFQALTLLMILMLSYFDCRRAILAIGAVYLVANTLFTLLFLQLGMDYYGYGFFLASAISFFIAATILFSHVYQLPYHAFVNGRRSASL
jgi:uncharacterized membrane protein